MYCDILLSIHLGTATDGNCTCRWKHWLITCCYFVNLHILTWQQLGLWWYESRINCWIVWDLMPINRLQFSKINLFTDCSPWYNLLSWQRSAHSHVEHRCGKGIAGRFAMNDSIKWLKSMFLYQNSLIWRYFGWVWALVTTECSASHCMAMWIVKFCTSNSFLKRISSYISQNGRRRNLLRRPFSFHVSQIGKKKW